MLQFAQDTAQRVAASPTRVLCNTCVKITVVIRPNLLKHVGGTVFNPFVY